MILNTEITTQQAARVCGAFDFEGTDPEKKQQIEDWLLAELKMETLDREKAKRVRVAEDSPEPWN